MKEEGLFLGVIGGSGLYNIEGAKLIRELDISTPWGNPSDAIRIIELDNQKIAFLARHGKGHRFLPSEVPWQANIAAMKSIGVEQIFAFSAVGSLKEELAPMDFVLLDQIIDRTKQRPSTFFGDGIVGHVSFADPFCIKNASLVEEAAQETTIPFHTHETAVCMEGPAFSTRAESHLYRSWGAGVINMTVLPEAKLAREAGICYNTICMVTDYDCWRENEEAVSTDKVIEYLHKNSQNAEVLLRKILKKSVKCICQCHTSADKAIMTAEDVQPQSTKRKLHFLYPEKFAKN